MSCIRVLIRAAKMEIPANAKLAHYRGKGLIVEQEKVKAHFRAQVPHYQDFMRRIVPGYDIQSRLLVDLIPFDTSAPLRVLDLGSGPGVLSKLVLERYPKAEVVAFDLTEEMLASARERCRGFANRFSTVTGDYAVDDIGSGYGLILAGLTLHHLSDQQRRAVFRRLHAALTDAGAFLAREVVADDDPFIADWHYRSWRAFMTEHGEDGEHWFRKHLSKDHPASVEKQTTWLRDAGFAHVACHWRHMNFAILSAHKGGDNK